MLCVFNAHSQVINISQTFSSDTLFAPFSGTTPIYSLKAYGNINLYSDSSLVRIVMVDSYGNPWLVYESYPLITDTNSFVFTAGCDETCFLDGIVPDSIRIDLISAFLTVDSLKLDTNYIPNATELQAQAKWNNDSVKINIMNQRIQEEHMYWRAGRTSVSLMSFFSKENLFNKKFNIEGLDFYKGGLFKRNSDNTRIHYNSAIVESYDWRYRHGASDENSPYFNSGGKGWFTPVKDQVPDTMINGVHHSVPALTCYVFSPVATVEARHNLVYNIHPDYPNPDISEMDVWRCPWGDSYNQPGPQYRSFDRLDNQNGFIVDESCFSYSYNYVLNNAPCSFKCNDPDKRLSNIQSENKYSFSGPNHTPDVLKKYLIEKGPCSSRIMDYTGPGDHHYMVIAGFSLTKEGDTVYMGEELNDPDIVIEPGSSAINTFYWYFKNSWGTEWGEEGFMKHENTSAFWDKIDENDIYVPVGVVNWYGHSLSEMRCTDEDGDGYYWWGVNLLPQNCNCPASVSNEQRDCDDNDPGAGPYVTDPGNPAGLYSCTPNDCETKQDFIEITEANEIWTIGEGDRHIDSNIIIRSNAKLTIHCQVFFTPGVKIIVQPDGVLELIGTVANPARLTSGCGEFWGGVELWGDPTQPQDTLYQGKIVIKNGIIEDAASGIITGNSDYFPEGGGNGEPYPVYPSGGIIEATGAIFRNNITGVGFYPYRRFVNQTAPIPNKSFFKACTFETTKQLLNDVFPRNLLKLWGINQLKIQGCTFRNTRDASVQGEVRGNGIFLYNAQLLLDTLHKLNGITVNIANEFDSLNYRIHDLYSGLGTSSLKVKRCLFNDNRKSLYASGFTQITPLEIDSSQFSYLNSLASDSVYLLYLNNCTGFKVHQNSFTGNTNQNIDQYGVIVNNSGTDNNYIYDNYFEKLTYGLQGLNINANSDEPIEGGVPVFVPTGLRFICNKFHDVGCTNDFLINENIPYPPTRPGIAYNQRNAANATNPTQEPAGNTFTPSHTVANTNDYDINISSSVGDILYTHHTTADPYWLRVVPNDVSNQDWVHYDPIQNLEYSEEGSCPNDFYPEGDRTGLRSFLSEANQKIDSLIDLLQFLVDEGSTDTLKSTVDNSSSSQSFEVYQELMGASPYLSDTVIKSSIEKEEVLPNVMIRDIMVANPQSPKSEELLDAIDQRSDPMPDSMWVEILQGMETVGSMEHIVGELSGWIQRRDLYFNALAELFIKDTVNSWAPDSLVSLYETDYWLSSHYMLMQYYLDRLDYLSAGGILQNIPSQFNLTERQTSVYQKYLTLLTLYPQMYNDTLGYLAPDSVQTIALQLLAADDNDFPGAFARNLLIASGFLDYQEPIVSESMLKSSRKGRYQWTNSRPISSVLKVFPNPAKDIIIAEYKTNNILNKALIIITDAKGSFIRSYKLIKNENQLIIPVENLPSGLYLIQLHVNGKLKESRRVAIIR
jgi:hypothetical protein